MLDDDIKQQLSAYLERVKEPFELVASLDDGASSAELRELLDEVVALTAPMAEVLPAPMVPVNRILYSFMMRSCRHRGGGECWR